MCRICGGGLPTFSYTDQIRLETHCDRGRRSSGTDDCDNAYRLARRRAREALFQSVASGHLRRRFARRKDLVVFRRIHPDDLAAASDRPAFARRAHARNSRVAPGNVRRRFAFRTCFFKFFGVFVLHALVGHQFDAAAPLLVPYGAAMVCLSFIGALGTYGIATHRLIFSVPLVVCAIGVLAAIAFYHPTLAAVVRVLLTGNLVTMAVVALALAAQGLAGERARARLAA